MDFTNLRELLDHFTSWRIPGCACAVYYKHRLVFSSASGYADVERGIPMDCDRNIMYMYSCSKPVTCASALMLWEKGKFLFTDPLYDFLPAWKDARVRALDGDGRETTVPLEHPITVGELFTMTSGLDYNTNGASFGGGEGASCARVPHGGHDKRLGGRPIVPSAGRRLVLRNVSRCARGGC